MEQAALGEGVALHPSPALRRRRPSWLSRQAIKRMETRAGVSRQLEYLLKNVISFYFPSPGPFLLHTVTSRSPHPLPSAGSDLGAWTLAWGARSPEGCPCDCEALCWGEPARGAGQVGGRAGLRGQTVASWPGPPIPRQPHTAPPAAALRGGQPRRPRPQLRSCPGWGKGRSRSAAAPLQGGRLSTRPTLPPGAAHFMAPGDSRAPPA